MRRLVDYPWPGNIRELQNVLERACVISGGPIVDITTALGVVDRPAPDAIPVADERILTLDEHEQQQIRRALDEAGGRIHGPGGAASLLGINASTLRSRMEKHGMSRQTS
jgi:DNA-binding NtrC family response regulator